MATTNQSLSRQTAWWGEPLAGYLGGRDNNFNLVRIVAALAVLVSHAFAVTTGDETSEPLRALTGLSLGQFAVAVFFGISGLLIARSFDRRETIVHFGAARFLRLWPALTVVILLSVFVLGPAMTELPTADFFASPRTWEFIPSNFTLVFRDATLPGVFLDNPQSPSTNGSLWSLFYEVVCYGGVVVAGYLGALRRDWRFAVLLAGATIGHVLSVIYSPAGGLAYRLDTLGFIGFPFVLGMAAYVWRDQVRLGPAGVALCWLLVAAMAQTMFFSSAIMAALVYTTLWLVLVPKGAVLAYNRVGDFSYGVYIFAYPIQQTLVAVWPGMSAWTNILAAVPLTLLFAIASWFMVEKPSLALARPLGDRLAMLSRRGAHPIVAEASNNEA